MPDGRHWYSQINVVVAFCFIEFPSIPLYMTKVLNKIIACFRYAIYYLLYSLFTLNSKLRLCFILFHFPQTDTKRTRKKRRQNFFVRPNQVVFVLKLIMRLSNRLSHRLAKKKWFETFVGFICFIFQNAFYSIFCCCFLLPFLVAFFSSQFYLITYMRA